MATFSPAVPGVILVTLIMQTPVLPTIGSETTPDLEANAFPITFGSVPVSYTHLRAHETVLDLVCRLLLEKKKKL